MKILSEEHKKKLSESHKGKIPWNKGKRGLQVSWNKGKKTPPHVIEKLKTSHIGKIGEKSSHWKGGKGKVICQFCGKEFLIQKDQIKIGWGKFCSYKCKGKWQSDNLIGEKSPAWKGGQTKKICKLCGKEFQDWNKERKFCSTRCNGLWNVSHNLKKNTSIEIAIEKQLKLFNIPYIKQCPLEGITIADFVLPNKIVIQCDGNYWHSFKDRINKDINQDFLLQFRGYKVFRFKESEIKKSAKKCILKIF